MTGAWSPVGEREVRVGLIGLGSMGRNHLRVLGALAGVPRSRPSPDPEPGALAAASARSGAQAFAEPLAMLAEADLDAVVIAAPTTSHLPLALAAIERGHRRPRREAARGDAGGGRPDRRRRIGAPARRRSRSATSSGSIRPSSSSGACSRRAGCRPSSRSRAAAPGPFPARIRDVGVTVDLATHDVDILSRDRRRAAGPRVGRDRPADPRRATRTSCSA